MVSLIIIGSLGLDDIETPFGKKENVLGGAASYASYAASFFAQPGVISIVGSDFPEEYFSLLKKRNIDTLGIVMHGKTFRWSGFYEYDMNEAKTKKTELNCITAFNPVVPAHYKDARFVFLANIDPALQERVLAQTKDAFVVMDTMNFWIQQKKEKLLEVIPKVNIFVCNEGEARMLFGTPNLIDAGKKILALGPKAAIIKKGEHGALLFTNENGLHIFSAPAYPLEVMRDPTGCGDCFGGAFTAYLAKTNDTSERNLRKAVVYGTAVASLNAEDFSLERLKTVTMGDIEERVALLKRMGEV